MCDLHYISVGQHRTCLRIVLRIEEYLSNCSKPSLAEHFPGGVHSLVLLAAVCRAEHTSKCLGRAPASHGGHRGILWGTLISTSLRKGHPTQQTPPSQTGGPHSCSSLESRSDSPQGTGEAICLFSPLHSALS